MSNHPLEIKTEAMRDLKARGIAHRVFVHPGPIDSLEQAAAERGQRLEQVIRSILFRVAEGHYVMVLVAGPKQIAWAVLRKYLGLRRTRMASPEEVETVTGAKIGAVSPFGLPEPLRLLADESIFEPDEISIGSGRRGTTLIMTRDDLRAALSQAEVGQFVS